MTRSISVLILCLFLCISSNLTADNSKEIKSVTIKWMNEKAQGSIIVENGVLAGMKIIEGRGKSGIDNYKFSGTGPNSLQIILDNVNIGRGSKPTLINVSNGPHSFSFFLRDVSIEFPIYIPDYNVIVSPASDSRSYSETAQDIKSRRLQAKLDRINNEPEESFESASIHTRDQVCPILLGLSRDVRIFEIGIPGEMETISAKFASTQGTLDEAGKTPANYCFLAGRGQGVENSSSRWIEEGSLPIFHKLIRDDDISYHFTSFASPEISRLSLNKPEGSHFLVADYYSYGHTFTEEQEEIIGDLLKKEKEKKEETVLYQKVEAENTSYSPAYAFFRTLRPGRGWWEKIPFDYDREKGFSSFSADRVFGISRMNGKPLPDQEIAVLLKPGEKVIFEFLLPHSPVSRERAVRLAGESFDARLADCVEFWKGKLEASAKVSLPDRRIDEMMKAGLLHLDLITYGKEPDGILAPCPGVYSPIGSESSPIIQFYSSMGLSDIAKRSFMFFLEKQNNEGMIQSFGGYMIETGGALYTIGEYFRYTHDTAWISEISSKLLKSCDYLIRWRERSKTPGLKGRGYGMIDGKVADPEDPYHQFMLNGYGYLGMKRMAEVFEYIDGNISERLGNEAEEWRNDIRESLFRTMAESPVVPAGDGTWCPTAPPWTEARAPRLLYYEPETFLSHGTFTVSDVLLGPLYLIFCEVLDPHEPASRMLLKYHSENFFQRNAAFSQPYYSRHNIIQLKLGLVKPFLKTYFNTVSALADRETYTFWEHLYQVSVHKTHEEAWFLMETRWMLYLEEDNTLRLLSGIPRSWLDDGKNIELKNVASYFGPVSLKVNSSLKSGTVTASVECNSDRMPQTVMLRLPHPEGKRPLKVNGGTYEPESETVIIKDFTGRTDVLIEY
ncbi:MAG: hypothetical protein GYA41_04625 [Bacteroidales bacterium]|nr:hypothetical protein [Bacteroidales bacterium]